MKQLITKSIFGACIMIFNVTKDCVPKFTDHFKSKICEASVRDILYDNLSLSKKTYRENELKSLQEFKHAFCKEIE